jgi:16S rRNA (cytidine1402-2'-O)-methyltransferase
LTEERTRSGTLYLVATPIGNLDDLSLRARQVLAAASLVAAEDTRHTQKLLSAHQIHARLTSYREQNHDRAAAEILTALAAGQDVALVSDAGTPGISDPGAALVAAAIEKGYPVCPIPGPCAAIAALAASGLATDRFVFVGFLPRKLGALRAALEALAAEPGSLVFYESPHRLGETLELLAEVLGPRPAVVVRELTKIHETFDRATLPELAARYAQGARGEITLLVAGAQGEGARPVQGEIQALVSALRRGQALPPGEIARLVAAVTGLGKREIYQLALGDAGPREGEGTGERDAG